MPTNRVAIVHPWVQHVRGGEKVFFELARAYPEADLFVLHCQAKALPPDIRRRLRGTSFLQRFPFHALPYRALLPLLTTAVESLDLSRYDTIISSASGWTHGVIPGEGAHHVSYVHSPPRYLWTRELPGTSLPGRAARTLAAPMMQYLRLWDATAAGRVDTFLANSGTTAQRVQRRYNSDAAVVHPPVETSRMLAIPHHARGYVLSVGELVAYKRVDLVIRACRKAGVPLAIVGDGPERARLERLAGSADVRFLGRVHDAELDRLLGGASAFIHPGIEDFGIATVEALVAGVPVVGRDAGGTAEIVQDGQGVLVASDEPDDFAAAIRRAMGMTIRTETRYRVAARFSPEAFREAIRNHVEESRAWIEPSSMQPLHSTRKVA